MKINLYIAIIQKSKNDNNYNQKSTVYLLTKFKIQIYNVCVIISQNNYTHITMH